VLVAQPVRCKPGTDVRRVLEGVEIGAPWDHARGEIVAKKQP
jgi:hypothetical protein